MVYMQESVTGLSLDAPVEYNGVNVGMIQNISINHENLHTVELVLSIKNGTPVTQGTVATLNTKGITGVAFIALKDTGLNPAPIPLLPNNKYPVITSGPSLFLRLDTALNKLNQSLSRVSRSIQTLLDPENQSNIKLILKNLNSFTAVMANSGPKFTAIMNNANQASQQLSPAIRTMTSQTFPKVDQLISNLDTLSKELKDNPSVLIQGPQQQPLGPGEQ